MNPNQSKLFFVIALAITLFTAGILSGFASDNPDGFEKVTAQYRIEESGTKAWNHAPMADYSVSSVENDSLSTGLSGIAGTLLVLALGYTLARFVQKKPGDLTELSQTEL